MSHNNRAVSKVPDRGLAASHGVRSIDSLRKFCGIADHDTLVVCLMMHSALRHTAISTAFLVGRSYEVRDRGHRRRPAPPPWSHRAAGPSLSSIRWTAGQIFDASIAKIAAGATAESPGWTIVTSGEPRISLTSLCLSKGTPTPFSH
jgi:hypothetical protein